MDIAITIYIYLVVCRMFLKDSLAIANKENIMRISAATVVLLGHLCLSSNVQDCSSMLLPGLEMASKIPDVPLQAWATSLLHGSL